MSRGTSPRTAGRKKRTRGLCQETQSRGALFMTVEPIVATHGVAALRTRAETARPAVQGKFIVTGEEKLFVRGVTYGTFRTDEDGNELLDSEVVKADFARMTESGINAIRTYTVPPRWLLDLAHDHDLRVMVGLPWEQHIAFL